MTTTPAGVDSNDGALSPDDAADAILNRWMDAGTLSDQDRGATTPDRRAETATEPDEEEEESDEELDLDDEDQDQDEGDEADDQDKEADEPVEAADEAVVKVTVDGEERKVPVKDLKRLYGQEASLTRKSQEVAQQRTAAEQEGARYTTAMQKLMERANERFKPYADIDWQIAQKTLNNEEFVALRTEALAAFQDVKFLQSEVDAEFTAIQEARQAEVKEAAKAAVEVLQRDIPGWSPQVYDSVISYAVNAGLEEAAIKQVTDPSIIKLLHKAMSYDAAKERAKSKRKVAAPKRVMKSKTKGSANLGRPNAEAEMARLQKEGTADAAADAFMARWSANSDD